MTLGIVAERHVSSPCVYVDILFNSGTRYYSSTYWRMPLGNYKAKIISISPLRRSVGDIYKTYEQDRVSIIMDDSDYEFRGLEESEAAGFKNISVDIFIWVKSGTSGITGNSTQLFSGRIFDWKKLENLRYQFDIEANWKNIDLSFPDKQIETSDYPYAYPSHIGKIIPYLLGEVSDYGLSDDGAIGHPELSQETGCLYIDTRMDNKKHLICVCETSPIVSRVYMNGVLKSMPADYTILNSLVGNLIHSKIIWAAGVNPTETDFITADASRSAYGPCYTIFDLMKFAFGYVTGDFNGGALSSSNEIETNRGYVMNGMLWEKKTLREWLDLWRDEFELDIYRQYNGSVTFDYLNAADRFQNPASSPRYKDFLDIFSHYKGEVKAKELCNWIRMGYYYNYAKNYYYKYQFLEDTVSQTKNAGTYKGYGGYRFVRSDVMARDITMRKLIRFAGPMNYEKYVLPLKAFDFDLANTLRITQFEGSGSAGHVNKLFQIREMTEELEMFTNEVGVEDMSNYIGRACILGDDTKLAATWAAADVKDREYCYLCSSTDGKFSDGEPGKMLVD